MSEAQGKRIPANSRDRGLGAGVRLNLGLVFLAAASGCSHALGPENLPIATVSGRVMQGTRPLDHGWVEFFPADGTLGNLRSARIQPDGSFSTSGVAVGLNVVRLVDVPIESKEIRGLLGAFHSPIRRRVHAGGESSMMIDVFAELRRLQQSGFPEPGVDTGKDAQ